MKRVTDYFATVPAKKVAAKSSTSSSVTASTQLGSDPTRSLTTSTGSTKESDPKGTESVRTNESESIRTTDAKGNILNTEKSTTAAKSNSASNSQNSPTPTPATAEWKEKWIKGLTPEQKELLDLEINTMHDSWLEVLRTELTKPYFLNLKRFLKARKDSNAQVFPPENYIYSWTRITPLHKVKVLILGQDPYHNVGQAHGLAFSVRAPTRPPPSLVNIYKELKSCYPNFEIPKHGSLVKWGAQGVLMLNACLTVDAHQANSHSQRGWEQFTEEAIKAALKHNSHIAILAWGSPAAKRVEKAKPGPQHLVLRSVHPSPLSASRGWFGTAHFVKANEWLEKQGEKPIVWHLV